MRTPQPLEAHKKEAQYIANAWPSDAKAFNDDPECFNDYIDMQANAAQADGFTAFANMMRSRKVPKGWGAV